MTAVHFDNVSIVSEGGVSLAPVLELAAGQNPNAGNGFTLAASSDRTATWSWQKVSGPGTVTFKTQNTATPQTAFTQAGSYGIRATALLPGEVATPILDKRPTPPSAQLREQMVQAQDMGQTLLFLAQLPARACINELIISPTHNRFYMGGLETPPPR